MEYRIEYNSTCAGGVNPDPLTIDSPYTSTAMDIMELAVDEGREYRFEATYFGVSIGGYFIDTVNGTSGNDSCYWFFYIQPPGGDDFKPQIGVSTYIPGENFIFTLRYETFRQPEMLSTTLNIEFLDPVCSTATPPEPAMVSIPTGSNVLAVMQRAVDNFGRDYRFSATYFGSELGFFIDTLSGTSSNVEDNCFWIYYIDPPNGDEFKANLGVSNYIVPADGYTITWRFMQVTDDTSQVAKVNML